VGWGGKYPGRTRKKKQAFNEEDQGGGLMGHKMGRAGVKPLAPKAQPKEAGVHPPPKEGEGRKTVQQAYPKGEKTKTRPWPKPILN